MIQYENSPLLSNNLGGADRWAAPFMGQGFDSGSPGQTSRVRAAGSPPDYRRSLDAELHIRQASVMADAPFQRSASTNALASMGSANGLSGQGGSSNNLMGLASGSTQSLNQSSQYDESAASAIQRSFSQLQLAAQAESATRALGSGPQHGSYDSLADLDQSSYRRVSTDHRQGDAGMANQGGQSGFSGAVFPVAHSMPVPGNSGSHDEEVFHRDTHSRMPFGRSQSSSNLGQHPSSMLPELTSQGPCRTLLIRNVDPTSTDDELRRLFEPYGDIKSLYTGLLHSGAVIIIYHDLRAAALAVHHLHRSSFKGQQLSVTYSESENGRNDSSTEGIVSLMNVTPGMTNENVLAVLSQYGEVKAVIDHPTIRGCRLVEFYDLRHAAEAFQKINSAPGKIPTISEDQAPSPAGAPAGPRMPSQASQDQLNKWRQSSNWDLSLNDPFARMFSDPGMQSNPQFSESSPDLVAMLQQAAQAEYLRPLMPFMPGVRGGMQQSNSHQDLSSVHRNPTSPPQTGNNRMSASNLTNSFSSATLSLLQNQLNHQGSRMPTLRSVVSVGNLSDMDSRVGGAFYQGGLQRPPFRPHIGGGAGQLGNAGIYNPMRFTSDSLQNVAIQNFGQSHSYGSGEGAEAALNRILRTNGQHPLQVTNGPYGPGPGVHMGRGDGPRQKPRGREDERVGGRLSRRPADPQAEAERKAQQDKMYALDLDKVQSGEDKRTTLMIKNIPNKYTQKMLLATIDAEFKGTYDFFYLPIDFKNKCNVGYAFINLIQPQFIIGLVERFNQKKWEKFNSEKICHISYARIQGKASLVTHFQNSSLLHEDKRCRPVLFHGQGPLAGEQEPFPSGSNPRSRPST